MAGAAGSRKLGLRARQGLLSYSGTVHEFMDLGSTDRGVSIAFESQAGFLMLLGSRPCAQSFLPLCASQPVLVRVSFLPPAGPFSAENVSIADESIRIDAAIVGLNTSNVSFLDCSETPSCGLAAGGQLTGGL